MRIMFENETAEFNYYNTELRKAIASLNKQIKLAKGDEKKKLQSEYNAHVSALHDMRGKSTFEDKIKVMTNFLKKDRVLENLKQLKKDFKYIFTEFNQKGKLNKYKAQYNTALEKAKEDNLSTLEQYNLLQGIAKKMHKALESAENELITEKLLTMGDKE